MRELHGRHARKLRSRVAGLVGGRNSAGFSAELPASVSLSTVRRRGSGVQPLRISVGARLRGCGARCAAVFTRRAADGLTDLYRYPVNGGVLLRRSTRDGWVKGRFEVVDRLAPLDRALVEARVKHLTLSKEMNAVVGPG